MILKFTMEVDTFSDVIVRTANDRTLEGLLKLNSFGREEKRSRLYLAGPGEAHLDHGLLISVTTFSVSQRILDCRPKQSNIQSG